MFTPLQSALTLLGVEGGLQMHHDAPRSHGVRRMKQSKLRSTGMRRRKRLNCRLNSSHSQASVASQMELKNISP